MRSRGQALVVAFYPHARGFAYVVFEGPNSPVDWGMSDVPRIRKVRTCLRRLAYLLNRYHPDEVVLRHVSPSFRRDRLNTLLRAMVAVAEERRIASTVVSRRQVQAAFAYLGLPTRHAIAAEIAKRVPIFAPLLPPARKIWNGEDRKMGLFDAAALALTYFHGVEDDYRETA